MAIEYNKGQKIALKDASIWYKRRDEILFKIVGPAGTGKTTIVFGLINMMGLDARTEVLFMTYVGKATLPLRKSGLLARTIHSTCYYREEDYVLNADGTPMILPNGRYKKKGVFKKKDSLPPNIKLLVVDEAGMVPEKMMQDILSFGIPVIALGDKDQLPPVFGRSVMLERPNAALNEIVRQKAGDPIIFISDLARKGDEIPLGKYGPRCFVVDETILRKPQIYVNPDIVLCGTNKTRDNINRIVREQIKGFDTPMPQFGDKMVCRKNNWDIEIDDIALINGLFGHVVNRYDETFNGNKVNIDFKPECLNEWYEDIPLDFEYLNLPYQERKDYGMWTNGNLFEYGYGSTVHLAQGSQYGYVMMIEEVMGDPVFQKKLLYTGITRAQHTIVLVRRKKRNQSFFF